MHGIACVRRTELLGQHPLQHLGIGFRIAHRPKGGGGQLALSRHQAVQQAIEALLAEVAVDGHRHMDRHFLGLTNAVNAVIALLFDRRVPPSAQVDDMCSGRQGQARSRSLRPQNEDIEPLIVFQVALEAVHNVLPLMNGCGAVDQIDMAHSVTRLEQFDEAILHLYVFDKHQHPFSPQVDIV